ncbi:GmrSD restriction endonuclease domain-containing protein [Haloarcula sp. GH36]|uniref:GmrSD restriction endonuclease domain-containing protein n=1 Tax=Haloarcula montana TaxID=3111776 RepID=UPI002D76DC92|nr:DUF262 domain-containing protein [Haloarcula sp. GH36]
MEHGDPIRPDDEPIGSYIEGLKQQQYQIPTFQREVVWERDNIKKLWDSIYRFYPIGSILIWNSDTELEKHREIGGHEINDPDKDSNFNYILDGQQRTTALLTSLYGVKGEWKGDFDPTLYIDLKVQEADDVDDANYKRRFLFEDEVDEDSKHVFKIIDIYKDPWVIDDRLADQGLENDHPIRARLRSFSKVLQQYRIPFIKLRDIEINEVTEIFERVNQEGEPLDIFDIIVAKTFRPTDHADGGFYLREMIEDFRENTEGEFVSISNKTYLEMLAMIIKYHVDGNEVNNITDRFLNEIKTHQIEAVWDEAKRAFRMTFDFFENHLNLKGPNLVPFRYFYITVAFYFYENNDPDYDFLQKYFWFYSFQSENLLRHTGHLRQDHLDPLYDEKTGGEFKFEEFRLDKHDLRSASYSYQGRFSRAILAFMASHDPKDWKHHDRSVLTDVYYQLQKEPNLHHIFPRNFVENYPGEDEYDEDSLMNIAYLPQITNLEISDRNPIEYLRDYDGDGFDAVLASHLIPQALLEWSRDDDVGYKTLDEFINRRVEFFISEIDDHLEEIPLNVHDSAAQDTDVRVLIEDGESQTTEFKSTFRTDVEGRGMPTDRVEYQCLKTINGFLNSADGGTLLIGVEDDGNIYGLEEDYETFREEQKREVFQRHLHDIIGSAMEPRFNDFIDVSFVTMENKDVCVVNVDHASRPAHLENQGDQEFYLRQGNRTIPLEPKQQMEYINDEFEDS